MRASWIGLCLVVFLSAGNCLAEELKDIDNVVKQIQEELGEKFIVEKLEPFVVATDDVAAEMRSYKDTIQRCMDALYKEFFEVKPSIVIKVYLLKDDKSYRDYVKKSENREPTTPFGYCGNGGTKLVMNIGTGSGTLVHEMVHGFMKADFSGCPAWLNEGLGSLFEQCSTAGGNIRGLVNWRLPALQKALKDKKFVRFEKLMGMSEGEFYGKDSGANYAEARYLCMFMQEKELLSKFYKKFRDSLKDTPAGDQKEPKESPDPSGFRVFKELWDTPVEDIEKDFQKWAAGLKWR